MGYYIYIYIDINIYVMVYTANINVNTIDIHEMGTWNIIARFGGAGHASFGDATCQAATNNLEEQIGYMWRDSPWHMV